MPPGGFATCSRPRRSSMSQCCSRSCPRPIDRCESSRSRSPPLIQVQAKLTDCSLHMPEGKQHDLLPARFALHGESQLLCLSQPAVLAFKLARPEQFRDAWPACFHPDDDVLVRRGVDGDVTTEEKRVRVHRPRLHDAVGRRHICQMCVRPPDLHILLGIELPAAQDVRCVYGSERIFGYGGDLESIQAADFLVAGTVGQEHAVLYECDRRVAIPAVGIALKDLDWLQVLPSSLLIAMHSGVRRPAGKGCTPE